MPKLAQILEQSSGTRQVSLCVSVSVFLFWSLYKTNSYTLAVVLPHFDVICDLLLDRRTASWNLFLGSTVIENVVDDEAVVLSQCRFAPGITDSKFLSQISWQMIRKTASLKRFFLQQTTTFVVFLLRPCDKDSPYKIVVVTLDDLWHFMFRFKLK